MKTVLHITSLIITCLLITGCPKETTQELVRTSEMGETISKTQRVSTYKQQCEDYTTYGQDPSCGVEHFSNPDYDQCTSKCRRWATLDTKLIRRCEEDCASGQDLEYRSCTHTVTRCYKVKDESFDLRVDLNFDGATLTSGQTEKIISNIKQNGTKLKFKIKVESEHYIYDYPESLSLDLRDTSYLEVNFIKQDGKPRKKPKAPKNPPVYENPGI